MDDGRNDEVDEQPTGEGGSLGTPADSAPTEEAEQENNWVVSGGGVASPDDEEPPASEHQ